VSTTFIQTVVFTTAIAGALGCGKQQDAAVRTIQIYELLKALPRADVQAPVAEYVVVRSATVGEEQRSVIFMHPPARAEFPSVTVYADSFFSFAIGIQEDAWKKAGDGVEFTVQVKDSTGKEFLLFSRYIDPKHNLEDRHCNGVKIPLRRFAGQSIRLVVSTHPGPNKNADFDWAFWGEPQILLE
jgi:hypothetical protein